MPILTNIPVRANPDDVLAARGKRPSSPALVRAAEEAIALGATLWQPVVMYEWFDVCAVDGEQVSLAGPASGMAGLHVGPKADLLAPARRLIAAVMTIGPALEQRVRELEKAGETLMAFLLDSSGVLALGAAGEALRCLAEEEAAAAGWGVGLALSPGSLVGWTLAGQRELCRLLPLDQIGVRLNEQCVLVPQKSASTTIGIGPGYETHKVGSVCRFCSLAGSCWRRREDAA